MRLLTPEEKRAMTAILASFMEPRPPDLTIRVRDDIRVTGPDHEADAHLLMALGALVQSASRIEYQLRRAFVTLAGGDHSALVAAGQTSEWLMNMILAVADARSDLVGEPMSALKAIISRCRAALQQRHVYIHSLWGTTPNRGPRLTQSRYRQARDTQWRFSIEDVIELTNEFFACCDALVTWRATHVGGVQIRVLDDGQSISMEDPLVSRVRSDFTISG